MKLKLAKVTATQKSLILSVLACVGVGATGVLSAKCAKKTTEDMTFAQKLKVYIPAFVSGGVTIGCIGASTYISYEEIAAATAACAAIGQRFADYKKSVEDVVTDEQREQIDLAFYEKEIARLEKELAEREHPTEDDDLCTFVDSYTGYSFKRRKEDVEHGLEKVNEFYDENEFLYWCDIFYLINDKDEIPYYAGIGAGGRFFHEGYGWSKAMFKEFDTDPDGFGVELIPHPKIENVYVIDYPIDPEPCFMEY